jgi:uncharacterized protein (TIGR02271 family)
MEAASVDGDTITVPYDKATIKGAPHAEPGEPLSVEQEDELYRYYNVGGAAAGGTTDTTGGIGAGASDGDYITRSEERLRVGTQTVEAGRARLRKFVVTEQQTVTVPVSHDEVRIVREPLQPGQFLDPATISEDVVEVVLMEDRVHVDKQVVGVEKVTLATQTVTEQRQVTESVRKEQIELTGDTTATPVQPGVER